jgi:hypothetical protein
MERDKRERLPVTREVGSEGGSYADAMQQRATFTGPANPNVSPVDAMAGNMSVASYRISEGSLTGTEIGGVEDAGGGMIRYPTEPPSPPDAAQGRSVTVHPWRNGLFGLAVGTAALIGVSLLRRRS